MAAFDYNRMAALSLRLLQRFGAVHTLTRLAPGSRDVEAGTTPTTPTTYSVTGAKFDYAQRDIDGTEVRTGDQRFLMAPNAAVTPQTGDRLTIAGQDWQVIRSSPLSPAGTVVLHEVQIRQ